MARLIQKLERKLHHRLAVREALRWERARLEAVQGEMDDRLVFTDASDIERLLRPTTLQDILDLDVVDRIQRSRGHQPFHPPSGHFDDFDRRAREALARGRDLR